MLCCHHHYQHVVVAAAGGIDMVVLSTWHCPCRHCCMCHVVSWEGEDGGARPIVVNLSLQGEQTQSWCCCCHCPCCHRWCSGAMVVVVVAQVVLVVVVVCIVLWGGRGRGWRGQGPLSSTCRCEVNRLSHGIVAVIVAIVVIDAVVRWWWWGGNTALSSLLLSLLSFRWYRWCYHAILVVIDMGAWWWWHGGMVALLLFQWHRWCHHAIIIVNMVVQWWWWWHGVVVVSVAWVVPSCHRHCWRGGAMVVVVVTWCHRHRRCWRVGAVVVAWPRACCCCCLMVVVARPGARRHCHSLSHCGSGMTRACCHCRCGSCYCGSTGSTASSSWRCVIDREGPGVWWWARPECRHCCCHFCGIVVVVRPGAREPLKSAAKDGGGLGDKAAVGTWWKFSTWFCIVLILPL